MGFSKAKKAKMRKNNQKKIRRYCKDMIGHVVDYKNGYEAIDQAIINGDMYLLAKVEDNKHAIYKIVKLGEFVRLSPKRVLKKARYFSNHARWSRHSTIEIAEDGTITSAIVGDWFGPYNKKVKMYFFEIYTIE